MIDVHSQQLYGRKKEIALLDNILRAAFIGSEKEPIIPARRYNCQFVLVCGDEGTGKRSLVYSALNMNERRMNGTDSIIENMSLPQYELASGKFRPRYQSNDTFEEKPFAAFGEAIRDIMGILSSNVTILNNVQEELNVRLNSREDLQVLGELFPVLKVLATGQITQNDAHVLNESKGTMIRPFLHGPHLISQQAIVCRPLLVHYFLAVCKFVPFVIVLENLQYADAASLALVQAMMCDEKLDEAQKYPEGSKGLLLVATYKSENSLFVSDALANVIKHCKRNSCICCQSPNSLCDPECLVSSNVNGEHCQYHQISLSPISWDDVFEWIYCCEKLKNLPIEQRAELTDIVVHHSKGNAFYIKLLLVFCEHNDSMIKDSIQLKLLPDSIDHLYFSVLSHHDQFTQTLVKTAAALAKYGDGVIDCSVLETILQKPCSDIVNVVRSCGLLDYLPKQDAFCFPRDDLQVVSYSMIPLSEQSMFHLHVGKLIWDNALLSNVLNDDVISALLVATLQLHNSIDPLPDFEECLVMSKICVQLGQKLSLHGDFHSAAIFFDFAIKLHGNRPWCDALYEFLLELHNSALQTYCYKGDFDRLFRTVDVVLDNAKTLQDKILAHVAMVYARGSQHKLLEAFRATCLILQELGEPISSNPSIVSVVSNFLRTKWVLIGKSDNVLLGLPVAQNQKYLDVTQLLSLAMLHAYTVKPKTSILICFRLIRLALEKGMTGPAVVAFSMYGFVLCAAGRFDEGFRFGQIALQWADQFEIWGPRIRMIVYGFINQWSCPFRDCLEPLRQAQQTGLRVCDVEIYCGNAIYYLMTLLKIGSPLKQWLPLVRSHCYCVNDFDQTYGLLFGLAVWSFVSEICGIDTHLNVSGNIKDADTALKYAVKEGNAFMISCFYRYHALKLYLHDDYLKALQAIDNANANNEICDYELTFYEGLIVLAIAWTSQGFKRRQFISRGRKTAKRMKKWACMCPCNFSNKALLLEAEIAALCGKSMQSLSLFGRSIDKAVEESFFHEEAIAYKRLGQYYLFLDDESNARLCFESAQTAFKGWNATTVVNHMDIVLAKF